MTLKVVRGIYSVNEAGHFYSSWITYAVFIYFIFYLVVSSGTIPSQPVKIVRGVKQFNLQRHMIMLWSLAWKEFIEHVIEHLDKI